MKRFCNFKSVIVLIVASAALFGFIKPAYTIEEKLIWMKIHASDKFERTKIANLGVAIESVRDDYVYAVGTSADLLKVQQIAKVETSFELQSNMMPPVDPGYHNFSQVTSKLIELANKYPNISKLTSIGRSVEGRDIWSLEISGNLAEASKMPGIVYMGGHHAREHLSVELPLAYAQKFLEAYNQGDQRIVDLINSRDIHIIPAVNPDGLEYDVASGKYKMWRKNRSRNSNGTFGVDLNRNYAHFWGTGGSSKDPGADTYMGPAPFSEPETIAIRDFIESHENISTLLSFHTFSELILYPWGHSDSGIENAMDKQVHEVMANEMAKWNKYSPKQSSDLYIASGDTTDWTYGVHKIVSFTFELDPASRFDGAFYPKSEIIPDVINKNWEPVVYLLSYADNPYRTINKSNPFSVDNVR